MVVLSPGRSWPQLWLLRGEKLVLPGVQYSCRRMDGRQVVQTCRGSMLSALGNTVVPHIMNLHHEVYSSGRSKRVWRLVEIKVVKS